MKDYEAIAGIKKNLQDEADNIFRKGYEQGYKDGKKIQEEEDAKIVSQITKQDMNDKKACEEQAYQNGLDDAWEAVRKIIPIWTRSCQECISLFGSYDIDKIFNGLSASEAIAKIREYEEKQTAGESRDIRDIAIQGYIGTMMCNGYTVIEIEKVLKDMKEGINDNT